MTLDILRIRGFWSKIKQINTLAVIFVKSETLGTYVEMYY